MIEYINFQTLLILAIGFGLGAFPTGLFFAKYFTKQDILASGSGNVGAYNMYHISQSKSLGIATLLIDFIKGFLAVWIAKYISGGNFYLPALALLLAIAAHNWNPFLGWKGGRGLATAAGGIILFSPVGLFLWLFIFFLHYFIVKRNIIIANVVACFVSAISVFRTPDFAIYKTQTLTFSHAIDYCYLFAAMNILILAKHNKVFREEIKLLAEE